MYAIRNKITGQWLYGTDFREYPYRQRTSDRQALMFATLEYAQHEFKKRGCSKNEYEIVRVTLEIVGD